MSIRFTPPPAFRLLRMRSGILFSLFAAAGVGCGAGTDAARPQAGPPDLVRQVRFAPSSAPEIAPAALREAADRAARYLARACDAEGQFAYRINLDPSIEPQPRYNVVRHAGTLYALAQYCQRSADPEARAALLRAAGFLRQRCVAPVAGNPNFLGVWSDPELVGGDRPRQVKLGSNALGLVALLSVEKVEPGFTPLDDLRKIGRFLIFMQASDGNFYSKYDPERGRTDLGRSQYYPGEAALGLVMLYEVDPAHRWLHTATKALEHLAEQGSREKSTFPDHWYLLTLEQWFEVGRDQYGSHVRHRLLEHARRLCRDMLADQQRQIDMAQISGCFTSDGRTCPTATRLEGLTAALQYLPREDDELRGEIRRAVERGLLFLLDSQVVDGPHAGAVARYKLGFRPDGCSSSEEQRLQEVRIDYVQHALSAMLAGQEEFSVQTSSQMDGGPAEEAL